MNRAFCTLLVSGLTVVILACSSGISSGTKSEPEQIANYDFQAVETMLELDRTAAPLVYAAVKNATHPEFRTFSDEIGHRAFQRTEKIAAWKRSASAASKIQIVSLPCSSGGLATPVSTGLQFDVDLARALVKHRECGIAFAREVRKTSRIHDVQDIADNFIAEYSSDHEQLQTWISQWNRRN